MSDKGTGVLLGEPPILTGVEGKDYPLRRLGLMDIERLALIVRKVSRSVDNLRMTSLNQLTPQALVGFLIDFMPNAMDEIVRFMASAIGLKPGIPFEDAEKKLAKAGAKDPNEGTIRDPSVFPLGSEVRLLEMLADHPDVRNFFSQSKALTNHPLAQTLRERWGEQSTDSNTDTDGPTSTSSDDTSQAEETD